LTAIDALIHQLQVMRGVTVQGDSLLIVSFVPK
jgi:hypothetical protein